MVTSRKSLKQLQLLKKSQMKINGDEQLSNINSGLEDNST